MQKLTYTTAEFGNSLPRLEMSRLSLASVCLLEAGADFHRSDDLALRVAVMDGQLNVVKLLVNAQAR